MKGQFLGIPIVWFGLLLLTILVIIILFLWFTGLLDKMVVWLRDIIFTWWAGFKPVG